MNAPPPSDLAPDWVITELGVDGDEEARGITRMYRLERRRMCIVVVEAEGGWMVSGTTVSKHPDIARGNARRQAVAALERLRGRFKGERPEGCQ